MYEGQLNLPKLADFLTNLVRFWKYIAILAKFQIVCKFLRNLVFGKFVMLLSIFASLGLNGQNHLENSAFNKILNLGIRPSEFPAQKCFKLLAVVRHEQRVLRRLRRVHDGARWRKLRRRWRFDDARKRRKLRRHVHHGFGRSVRHRHFAIASTVASQPATTTSATTAGTNALKLFCCLDT